MKKFKFKSGVSLWNTFIIFVVLNMRLLNGQTDSNLSVITRCTYNNSQTTYAGETDNIDGFPRVPICKWASVSNWLITHSGNEERMKLHRELMEIFDDADELSGDISRPGSAEAMLREAVVHFSQVG